jgi:hypothetical protein
MKILLISNVENRAFEAQVKARGSSCLQLSPGSTLFTLERMPDALSADMILLDIRLESELGPPDFITTLSIAGLTRKLSDASAMSDGRKWNSLPIVSIKPGEYFTPPVPVFRDRPAEDFYEITLGYDVSMAYRALREIVWNYYQRVAADYTDIGYLVTDDNGRMRLETAYAPPPETNTKYYFRPADKRKVKTFTLARSLEGDANDLAEFTDIVDPAARSTEHRIHRFLADAPHILTFDSVDVLSHARIGDGPGRRELDFVERPYVNRALPETWWIVEIKRAFPTLLADLKRGEPRLAAALMRAVRQVRAYKQLIEDPHNRENVLKALGSIPQDARIAVLIGRRPKDYGEILDRQFARAVPDVTLTTYDDLLESRESALSLIGR